MLGLFTNGASKSVLKHLEDVRAKVLQTQELTGKYNKRMDELNKLNKVLTTGYVNNLNLVVDLSQLLTDYRDTLNEVLNVMKKFDDMILTDLNNTDIEHIKQLTDDKLIKVGKFFETDVQNVKSMLASLEKTELISRLDKAKENFQNTRNQSVETRAYLGSLGSRGGGLTRRKRAPPKRIIVSKANKGKK